MFCSSSSVRWVVVVSRFVSTSGLTAVTLIISGRPATASRIVRGVAAPVATWTSLFVKGLNPGSDGQKHRMTRLLCAAILAGAVLGCRVTPESTRPRDVVLISIDTMRADRLRPYGGTVAVPRMEALAADGIVFENAYAHSPQTLPSHVSILSGRLPFEHGVRDNVGFAVKRDENLLPTMLRGAGFTSGGFVSAYVLRGETGIANGFDRFDARLPPSSPEIATGELQRDGAATLSAANEWLDELPSSRFFLFFHIYEPHSPYTPPARFSQYAPYDGEIAYADEIVGGLTASLERRGRDDDAP